MLRTRRVPVIRGATFGSEIRRAAIDSDNWPMTWGDDDAQYTSYGDGFGFEPRVEKKLGMGFARITGGPADDRGVNIRSDGERTGDGVKSPKASGILMVDGVLYLWTRNVSNSATRLVAGSWEDMAMGIQYGYVVRLAGIPELRAELRGRARFLCLRVFAGWAIGV